MLREQAYKGSSSFISYSTVASSLVKKILLLCGLIQIPMVGRNPLFIPKTTDFGNILFFVEGTGPANTMVLKNHVQKM
jgi:hypothetical protein